MRPTGGPQRARRTSAAGLLAAAWLAAFASTTAAGVWKCRGDKGVPVYQDRPCAAGETMRDLDVDPPTLSVLPLPPYAASPAELPRRIEKPPPRARRSEPVRPRGDASERRYVREGMSEGEVLSRLGSPDLTSGKGARRTRWTFLPAPGDAQTMTTIRFEDGRVVSVERVTVR